MSSRKLAVDHLPRSGVMLGKCNDNCDHTLHLDVQNSGVVQQQPKHSPPGHSGTCCARCAALAQKTNPGWQSKKSKRETQPFLLQLWESNPGYQMTSLRKDYVTSESDVITPTLSRIAVLIMRTMPQCASIPSAREWVPGRHITVDTETCGTQ
jgi:hypothetical protein